MLLAVLFGFIVAILLLPLGKISKGKPSVLLSLLPLSLFVYFLSYIPAVQEKAQIFQYRWIPSLDIHFSFHLDGLALLFCLLITGIGTLVFFYSSEYLKRQNHLDRFWGYLSFFMASMLGLVLSDNIITLFVFWELTSISSFFLIGYQNGNPKARTAAMTALSITGLGGLFLLVGLLLIGSVGQSYSIIELTQQSDLLKTDAAYIYIIILIFIGAFTKSAQFPFHFWLPEAMQAPTPVSTYLHSATMVKAGIYLLARFTPMLGDTMEWTYTLTIVGGITMVYAGIQSLLRTDLKSILAYTTIAALGIIVFLLGIGHEDAWVAAVVFILAHALYKATLFLMTGAIDYSTGTRDTTKIRGLAPYMWPIAVAGILAALSHGGIPPTFGFVGKDLIYEATLHADHFSKWLTAAAIFTNVCLVFAGLMVGLTPFIGKKPESLTVLKRPGVRLWLPTILLGLSCLILGLFPNWVDHSIIQGAVQSILGTNAQAEVHLHLWHGFNTVLALSGLTLAIGIGLYSFYRPTHSVENSLKLWEKISPHSAYHSCLSLGHWIATKYTALLQNGYLRYYLLSILLFLIGLFGFEFFSSVNLDFDTSDFSSISFYEATIALIMLGSILTVVHANSRLVAVVALGVVGYSLSLFFMDFGAPDLAMTQFAIDTLTVVLFVLVLYRLPKYLQYSNTSARIRDGVISLCFGGLITLLALAIIQEPINTETSQFYVDNAYLLAKGKNIVNVILVDYRGVDTLGEITVITIAAIGVYGLLHLTIRNKKKELPKQQ